MASGFNIGIGTDLSDFQKGISIVNKQLKTVAGQKAIVNVDFKVPQQGELGKAIRKELTAAQGEMKSALEGISNVLYENKGQIFDIQNLKQAQTALSYLSKELKKAKSEGNNLKINSLSNDIASINEYIEAVGRLSNALARAGLASTPTNQAQMKSDRAEIDAQIKSLEKRRELLQGNTDISETARLQEEIKLQQQLVGLLQKKSETYKNGSRSNTNALYGAQQELETLRVRRQQITASERLADIQERINQLDKKRASASSYDKKITQLREERSAVRQLITAWERYAAIARKAGSATGEQTANAKIAELRKQHVVLKNLEEEERARIRATNQNNSLLNDQGRLFGKLKTLAANYLSIFAVVDFGRKIVETTGYFEQQQVALQGILGSAAAAQKALNELKGMAIESPFELKDLVAYTKQLSAYGIEQDKLLSTTKQLADLSTGLGVDMSRLILAYGQVKSASVLRGQELRQFTEAGIPMVEKLAEKFTDLNGKLVTTGEVFDLISERKVSFEMVAQVLSDMTSEGGKFYKMQENITDTLYGQVQKLKDTWTIALNDLGSGIGRPLRGFVELLQGLVKNIRAVMYSITGIALANAFKLFRKEIAIIKSNIAQWSRAMATFRAQVNAADSGARKLRITLSGIGKVLKSNLIIAGLSAITGAIINARAKAKEFSNSMKEIETSFAKDTAKYIQGFDSLIGKLSTMVEGTKEYNAALDTLKSNYGEFVNPALINHLIAERKQLDDTAEGWGVLHDSIVAAIQAKKDYERHEALKEQAGSGAVENSKSLKSLFGKDLTSRISGARYIQDNNLLGYDVKKYGGDLDLYNRIYGEIQHGNAESAFDFAKNTFIANDLTTEEELKAEIERSFTNSSVSKNVTKYILDNIDRIWDDLSNTKEFKEYLNQHNINENAPEKVIERRFAQAQRTTAGRQEGRWVDGMSDADYNPAKLAQAEDYDFALAVRDLIGGISQKIAEKKNAGESDKLFVDGEDGISNYEKALTAFNAQVDGLSVNSFEAAGKTKEIANALQDLANTITNGEIRSQIEQITGKFTQLAGVKTGRAASISTAIERDFLGGDLPHETKDRYKKYVPTDATIDEIRNGIKAEYDRLDNEIKSYGDKQGNTANAEYVKSLKEQQKILRTLAGEKYYDIDLSKSAGGGAVSIRTELNDFINSLKKAYETYKNATQKGGVEMGLGYVRNDAQFQEMFGKFFGGKDSKAFQQLDNVKIGNKSVSTMIQDKFISGGLEDGILDFESAAKEVAKELMAYYEAAPKGRAAFKTASEQLTKWIESTISKDNLNVALDKLEKEIKDLTLTFEKSTKNIDLYRKLVENGTAETVGKGLGVTRDQAIQTASSRQRSNVQAVVGKYNEQLSTMSNGQGTPYEINGLNNVAEVYQALEKLGELRKMNGENFAATDLGQTSATVENLLKQLLETMIQEMASISGERYTGNTLQDMVANSRTKVTSDRLTLAAAEKNATEKDTFDYAAIKSFVESNKAKSGEMYDQFLKDNRFDVLANGELGKAKVDFATLETKFNELIQNVPVELRAELESKLTDLKVSIQTYNSSVGAFGSFGDALNTYRNADSIAKAEYGRVSGDAVTLRTKIASGFNEDTMQAYSDEEIAVMTAELAAAKEKLEEMGTAGAILAQELKKVSIDNMQKSLEVAQSYMEKMRSAASSVIGAFKSLSNSVSKVYDIMNDGENPEWMQQCDDYLNALSDAFDTIVAPIMAVMAAIMALTIAFTLLNKEMAIAMAVIMAIAAIGAAIVAAFQAHDKALERQNEALTKKIEDTENAMKNLNAAAERMTGFDQFETKMEASGKNLENYQAALEKAKNEEEKKNTDEDKVKDNLQEAQEYLDTFLNDLKDMRDDIVGSVESWADAMSSAMRSAFQNGENAARAMKASVNEMIGDMIENMLKMAVLEPLLQNAMDSFLGGSVEDIKKKYTDKNGNFDSKGYTNYIKSLYKSEDKVNQLAEDVQNAGTTTLDAIDSLPEDIKKYLTFNSDRSGLSSGIESITEDTARTLEGLFNSQLGVTLQIRQLLEDHFANGDNGSGTNAIMTSIQTHVGAINSNVALILQGLNEVRDTQSRPIHVTMV